MNKLGAFMNYGRNALTKSLASRGYRIEKAETKKAATTHQQRKQELDCYWQEHPELLLNFCHYGYIDVAARIEAHAFVKSSLPYLHPRDNASQNIGIPKKVWMYWDKGWKSPPPIVELCAKRLEEMSDGFTVEFLDYETAKKFTCIPGFVYERLADNPTELANVIRLNLLERHGGLWLDATCYVTKPLDRLYQAIKSQYFSFTRNDDLLCNWLIMSSPSNIIPSLVKQLHLMWWSQTARLPAYFWFHYLFEGLIYHAPDVKKNGQSVLSFEAPRQT